MFSFSLLVGFVIFFFAGHQQKLDRLTQQQINVVATRIALDEANLPLADSFFNYAGDSKIISNYLDKLNSQLEEKAAVIRVRGISNSQLSEFDNYYVHPLETSYRTIYVHIEIIAEHAWFAYIFVLVMVVFNTVLYKRAFTKPISIKVEHVKKLEPPHLIVDLYSKSILLSNNKEVTSQLANKPLCFYLAMLEFCHENPDKALNQNKDVPEDLIEKAEHYFHRLAVLGHTVRKKPNFTNSLEKTLSEIRAALDEVLGQDAHLKAKLYPPKAHGEGSRSKLHNYALNEIANNDFEVVGK